MSHAGFRLSQLDDPTVYQGRPAWAIYYAGKDCKLQVCWSARDGGIDFLLAPLEAPNEFGLSNASKKWHLMLMLSKAHDDLATPVPDADDEAEMSWLKALFEIHFESAHAALLSSDGHDRF
ncbi:hypothetical protein H7J81_04810 [Mycobacterium cookii]|nr:hypothetical protein [Mycobacterium cookii]